MIIDSLSEYKPENRKMTLCTAMLQPINKILPCYCQLTKYYRKLVKIIFSRTWCHSGRQAGRQSVSLFVCESVTQSDSVNQSISQSVCQPVSLSVSQSVGLSAVCRSVSQSDSQSVSLSASPSVRQFVSLFVCMKKGVSKKCSCSIVTETRRFGNNPFVSSKRCIFCD